MGMHVEMIGYPGGLTISSRVSPSIKEGSLIFDQKQEYMAWVVEAVGNHPNL